MTNDNYEHICDNTPSKETLAKSLSFQFNPQQVVWHFLANDGVLLTCLGRSEELINR